MNGVESEAGKENVSIGVRGNAAVAERIRREMGEAKAIPVAHVKELGAQGREAAGASAEKRVGANGAEGASGEFMRRLNESVAEPKEKSIPSSSAAAVSAATSASSGVFCTPLAGRTVDAGVAGERLRSVEDPPVKTTAKAEDVDLGESPDRFNVSPLLTVAPELADLDAGAGTIAEGVAARYDGGSDPGDYLVAHGSCSGSGRFLESGVLTAGGTSVPGVDGKMNEDAVLSPSGSDRVSSVGKDKASVLQSVGRDISLGSRAHGALFEPTTPRRQTNFVGDKLKEFLDTAGVTSKFELGAKGRVISDPIVAPVSKPLTPDVECEPQSMLTIKESALIVNILCGSHSTAGARDLETDLEGHKFDGDRRSETWEGDSGHHREVCSESSERVQRSDQGQV